MRIAHVVSYFQPEFGYEEYYSAREQAKMGHDVHVITSDRIFPFRNVERMLSDIGSPHSDRMRGTGISEVSGITVHRLKTTYEVLYDMIRYGGVEKEIRAVDPDVVHAHLPWSHGSQVAADLKGELGFRLVVDEHGYATTYDTTPSVRNWMLDKEYRMVRAPRARKVLEKADAVVAVSKETESFLRDFYGLKNVHMIPLGVDQRRFRFDAKRGKSARHEIGLTDEFLLITAGRLDRAKRVELFVDAVNRMETEGPHLLIVGTGDEDYIKELRGRACDRVHFLGFRPPEALSSLYSAADLGVWGKASITIREAMSCSLPLLLLDTEDLRSLLKWSNGTFCPGDPGNISDALTGLMQDRARLKRMGLNGRSAVEKELSVEVQAKRLLEIYAGGV